MGYLTREVLDKILPKGVRLDDKAQKIAGVPKKDPKPLEACLLWLADRTDRNNLEGPVLTDALMYEGHSSWYVAIENGHTEYVYGNSPTLTALRAVVVMHCWQSWHALPPDERPDFIKYVEEFMAQ